MNQFKQVNTSVHKNNKEIKSELELKDSVIVNFKYKVSMLNSDIRRIKMERDNRMSVLEEKLCLIAAKNESVTKKLANKYKMTQGLDTMVNMKDKKNIINKRGTREK